MARVKCKKCGASCCDCNGCATKNYINGICPLCQKKLNDAITTNKGVPELRESKITITANRLQST